MSRTKGNRYLSGTHARIFFNGLLIATATKIDLKITPQREDVQVGMDIDTKITGLKGEGTLSVTRTTSIFKEVLEKILEGKDVRGTIVTELKDPDATGGQVERYQLNNVALNEFPIAYEMGAVVKSEFSFGFTPGDMIILETID